MSARDYVILELGSLMREALTHAAVAGHRAAEAGQSEDDMLVELLPAAEPFVQAFLRRVVA